MGTDEDQSESIRIAHLTMLQGVISRMGSNSFTLKALSATFGSAAVAIMAYADKPSPYYAIAAVLPILIFWLMDAQYLRYERAYRSLFNRVRKGEEIEAYDLDASPFMDKPWAVLKIAISWSVNCFYFAILLSLGFISILIAMEG
ncbi:hypothetical protein [Fodinicurvata sp. EGI_FJ10296]|uniref:hypothetical protein n=1 Tax=Fodinicurvata sp. EGI_FJ10296 TaxID=3231908 RepID=UPI003455E85C